MPTTDPREARDAFSAFEKEVGLRADVYASLNVGKSDRGMPVSASLYPFGIGGSSRESLHVEAGTFEEALIALRTKWDEHKADHEKRVIRAMALRIIQITADAGECTDAALRGAEFSHEQVKRFGSRAVEDANALASNGPFAIKDAATSNGAPETEAA